MSVTLKLFDNPKVSSAPRGSLGDGADGMLRNYRRTIRREGGYWIATGDFVVGEGGVTRSFIEEIFLEGMMRKLREEVGGICYWEGILADMEIVLDGETTTRSLLDCANAIKGIYSKIGDNLFSNGSVEDGAWTQSGSCAYHAQTSTWSTVGDYGMWVRASASDSGTEIETGITIESGRPYQSGVSLEVRSGTWTYALKRTDNNNALGQASSTPGFRAVVGGFSSTIDGSPSGATLVYNSESTEGRLAALLALGNTTVYNATEDSSLTATSVDVETNTITFSTAVPAGWTDEDEIYAWQTASGLYLAYASSSGDDTLENRLADDGDQTLYNPNQNDSATVTAIDDTNDILTLDSAISGWTYDDVLGALANTDRLSVTISEDNEYSGTIYARVTCDGWGEMFADAAVLQLSPYQVETSWQTDADSIEEFGRIEDILLEPGMTDSAAAAKVARELQERAWPRSKPPDRLAAQAAALGEKEEGGAGQPDQLRAMWIGLSHTMNWLHVTSGGTDSASDHITALAGACEFVSVGKIDDNATQHQVEEASPIRIWDAIEEIIDIGDGSGNKWQGGVYADGLFYYEQAGTSVDYHYRGGVLLDANGHPVNAWEVLPGLVRMDNMPVGPGEITGEEADDPRNILFDEVEFIAPDKWTLTRGRSA